VQKEMTAGMLFGYMGIALDKYALADQNFTMQFTLPNVNEQHTLQIRNGVLLVYEDWSAEQADVSVTCPKNALMYLMAGNAEAFAQAAKIEGDAELLTLFAENLTQVGHSFNGFNIVEP